MCGYQDVRIVHFEQLGREVVLRKIASITVVAVTGLILAAPEAVAQAGFELGVRGGVSVASASLDVSETFSKSNRTGFTGGVFANLDLGMLGLQVAGQYTQAGVTLDFGDAIDDLSIDYLEIPGVIKLGIPLAVVKPSLFAGAALGFNTGCDNAGVDCGDDVKSTDWKGIVGADVALYLGSVSLWADGRFNFGLASASEVDELKNRNWIFQAGLAFKP
jgi:hypothetical protein